MMPTNLLEFVMQYTVSYMHMNNKNKYICAYAWTYANYLCAYPEKQV